MKKIIIGLFFVGFLWAGDVETISPTPVGTWDFQGGTVKVTTPTANENPVNLGYFLLTGSTISYAVNAGTSVYSVTSGTAGWAYNSDKLDGEHGSSYGVKDDIGVSTAANAAALDAEIAETDTNFTIVNSSLTGIHDNYAQTNATTSWTGDNTFNGIKINAGSYVTKIKGGEQTGNIVYTLPISTDGVVGYHLQYSSSGALSWQPPELVGVQNYYYSTQTINGDYVMYSSHSAVSEGTISKTITADVILGTWTTLSGYPTGDAIPAGTWDVHVHAVQTAGTKDCRLYGKIYLKESGGSLTYLGETGKTKVLSDTEQAYDIMLQTGVINLTAGGSILMVGNAEPSGSGSDPQIAIYFGGTKDSLLALPAPTIDVNNYIPYTGATKNVNLGAYDITAANLTTNFAATNSSLTYIHDNYATDAEVAVITTTYNDNLKKSSPTWTGTQIFTSSVTISSHTNIIGLVTIGDVCAANVSGAGSLYVKKDIELCGKFWLASGAYMESGYHAEGDIIYDAYLEDGHLKNNLDCDDYLLVDVSTSPTNVDDVSTKGYCDYAVKGATDPLVTATEFAASTNTLASSSTLAGYPIDNTNAGTDNYILKFDDGESDWNWEEDTGGNGAGVVYYSKSGEFPCNAYVTDGMGYIQMPSFAVTLTTVTVNYGKDGTASVGIDGYDLMLSSTTDGSGSWQTIVSSSTLFISSGRYKKITTGDFDITAIPSYSTIRLDCPSIAATTAGGDPIMLMLEFIAQ